MKILLTLSTETGGELDRQTIEANENASTDVPDSIFDAIQVWTRNLAPGDIIKIVEVS
jgi:hypothetical protein